MGVPLKYGSVYGVDRLTNQPTIGGSTVTRKKRKDLVDGAWIKCEGCGDWWCTVHKQHAYDCDCPPIDEWVEAGKWPYREQDENESTADTDD